MNINVRLAEPDDYIDVKNLLHEVHFEHVQAEPAIFVNEEALSREEYLARIQDENSLILIAEKDKAFAGFCMCRMVTAERQPGLTARKLFRINNIAVDSEKRRLGVGEALYRAAQDAAHKHTCDAIDLNAWTFNHGACSFYEALGMRCVNKRFQEEVPC